MSISFTGTGSWGARMGVFAGRILSANLSLGNADISAGGLLALGVGTTNIRAQFNSALQFVVDSLYAQRDTARTAFDTLKSTMASYAAITTIEQADAAVTLVSRDLTTALQEVIVEMAGSGTIYAPDYYVALNTCAAGTPAANSANTGTGVMVASIKRPDGRASEYAYAETIEAICTQDAQAGGGLHSGATARQEQFSVNGETAASSLLSWDWPKGSGISTTLTAVDCDGNNALGNLLYNSNFSAVTTANQPDYWGAPLVGVCGTDIFSETVVVNRTGGKALKFTGTGGSPLSSIAQTFGVATPAVGTSGTAASLKPSTTYAFNCFVKDSGAGLVAGVLKIDLVNASNTNIADDAAVANSATVAFSVTTASYASFSGFFRTPKVLPSAVKLRVSVSTALTSTESMYVADLALTEIPAPLYVGGPFVALFAGATNFIFNDKITCAITNSLAGVMQTWAWRMFNLPSLGGDPSQGLQLPSASGGTVINDNLVA